MVVLRKQKENTTTAVGTTLNQSFFSPCSVKVPSFVLNCLIFII